MPTVLLVADDEAVRSTSQVAGGGQSRGGSSATNFGYYDLRRSMTQTRGAFFWLPLRRLKEPNGRINLILCEF
jgi:hypothetical protein